MAQARKQPNTAELFRDLSAQLKNKARVPDIHAYEPHAKQEVFHRAVGKKKLYLGGNRSGKSEAGVIEDIWWAMGDHRYRNIYDGLPTTPNGAPTYGRVVGVDFTNGIKKILLPKFSARIPPSLLVNGSWEDSYSNSDRVLTLANRSTIEFMSYDQDTDKFAGTARHWTHFDEEPPKEIFDECKARLIDYGGSWWLTMTPVEGMTWVYDELYQRAALENILVVESDMLDNPHISREAADDFLAGLSEADRKTRRQGKFVSLGGRVYASFERSKHVLNASQFRIPRNWEVFASVDHGFNNPTAWLWHAVGPNNQVVTFAEHYEANMTVQEHASIVLARELGFGRPVLFRVGDPAMSQRSAVTGNDIFTEYSNYGVHIGPAPTRDVNLGVTRINGYLRTTREDGLANWLITDNCPNLISELEHVHWDTFASKKMGHNQNKKETIHKKNDHATDSARYFFVMRPDLLPTGDDIAPARVSGDGRSEYGSYDVLLKKSLERQVTNWRTDDEELLYE